MKIGSLELVRQQSLNDQSQAAQGLAWQIYEKGANQSLLQKILSYRKARPMQRLRTHELQDSDQKERGCIQRNMVFNQEW